MKILYLGNNLLGFNIFTWLKSQKEEIVGMVIHPEENQKYVTPLLEKCQLTEDKIFYANDLQNDRTIEKIKSLQADIGVSILFDYILSDKFLSLFPKGCINLHPSFLPYNRGQFPNVWSIIDKTPAGSSIHYMSPKVDAGDLIAQTHTEVKSYDTGKTLYQKLMTDSEDLFKVTWPSIKDGSAPRLPQLNLTSGTHHKKKDVNKIDRIYLNEKYTAGDLIDILRARTFPPYDGAYYVEDGKKIFLRIEFERR